MERVTIRDLRNRGGDVVDRVAAGEALLVTRGGKPVAELRPVRPPALDAEALLRRWRDRPPIDASSLRRDVDSLMDQRL